MRFLWLWFVLLSLLAPLQAFDKPSKQKPRIELGFYARQELTPAAAAALAQAGFEQPFVPGSYMVEFQANRLVPSNAVAPGALEQAKASARRQLRTQILDVVNRGRSSRGLSPSAESDVIVREYSLLFDGVAARLDEAAAQELRTMPGIRAVSPERILATNEVSQPLTRVLPAFPGIPGFPGGHSEFSGQGVVIAVVDTGIDYTHPDLGGCLGQGCKVIGGYDFPNHDADPQDGHGHGTHVAGIAAAKGQLQGIAPDALLLAVKVLTDQGYGMESDVVAGVEWAVANGADIVNMSLGTSVIQKDDPLVRAVENAVALGVVVVVAAGNSGPDYYTVASPGVAESALTVGASMGDELAPFSSRGPTKDQYLIKPELIAPGVQIKSTVPRAGCNLCDSSGYREASGTSMASPYVAGAAALLLERAPALTPRQVKWTLAAHTRDLSMSPFFQGSGVLDIQAAVSSSVALSHDPMGLGLLEPAAPDLMRSVAFQLTNSSAEAVTYDLSFDRPLPAGFNITPSASRIVVPPGQTTTLTLGVLVQNGVLPPAPIYPCDYSGALIARSATDTIRIPFALLKGAVFNFSVPDASQAGLSPYALLIHDRNGWAQWHRYVNWLNGPLTVILPPAEYDVIASYFAVSEARDAGVLVKERLSLESRMEVTLEAKEMAHRLKFQPSYPQGAAHARREEVVALLRHKTSGMVLPIHSGMSLYTSAISQDYSLELLMVNDGTPAGKPLFTFQAFLPDGVHAPAVFENDPADFRYARLDHSLRAGNSSLQALMFLEFDEMRMVVSFSPPAARDVYFSVPPNPEHSTGTLSELVFEPNGRVLYSTARWRAVNRSLLASYAFGDDVSPVASTAAHFIPAAVGPFYWFGRFENRPDQVTVIPSVGVGSFLMRGQCGDYIAQESLPYEIQRDGGPTASVTYPAAGTHLPSVLAVDPGAYTITIRLPDPSHPGSEGKVTARFDTTRTDADPPYLRGFSLTKRDELTEVMSPAYPRTLRFSAADNVQLRRVELWFDQGAGAAKATVTHEGNDQYRVILPPLGNSASGDLRLELEDISGNLLQFETTIWSASPDLAVRATGQEKALVGRNSLLEVTIANSGLDSTDSEVTLIETLPAGLRLVSAGGDHWNCGLDGRILKCRRSNPLFAKTQSTLSLVLGVGREAYPSVSTRFEVGNAEDPNAENNAFLLTASVDGTAWWTGLGPAGGEVFCLAADPETPGIVYAGVFGQIYRSPDHGVSWTPAGHGLPDAIVTAIAVKPGDPQVLFAGTDGWGIWKSSDGGASWEAVKSALLEDAAVRTVRFHPSNRSILYAGLAGKALRSTDGGGTWSALDIDPLPVTYSDIAANPQRPTTIYAGNWEKIYVSTDGGASWRVSHELSLGVSGLNSGSGDFGRLDKWLRFAFDPDDPLTVWANSLISLYKTTDGGVTWETNPVPVGFLFGSAISIARDQRRTMYIAFGGRVARSVDRGNTWEQLAVSDAGYIDDLLVAGDGRILAANAGGVQSSSDFGDNWVTNETISAIQAKSLALDPHNPGSLLAATNGGLLAGSGGTGWSVLDRSMVANLLLADPHRAGTFYAAGEGVWKSTDGGKSWQASSTGLEGTLAMTAISALVADPLKPGHLYLGTGNRTAGGEGVFRSVDGGGSWTKANSGLPALAGVDCLVIDPESGRLFASIAFWGPTGTHYGLYRSTNGSGWTELGVGLPRARINAIAFTGTGASRVIMVGTEGSGVFRSDDYGATWKPSGNGLPENPKVRAIAVDADGVMYAAGYGAGVFVSRDGGHNWSRFADGLSNYWVTSLVLDPRDGHNIYLTTSTGVFAISLAPDLAVTMKSNKKLLSGGAAIWSVDVGNKGSGSSRGQVELGVEMPQGLRLLRSSGFGWDCTAGGANVRCSTRERVDPGSSLGVLALTFGIDEAAPRSSQARIRVDSPEDVVPANDLVNETFEILPASLARMPLFRSGSQQFFGLALANLAATPTDTVLSALDEAGGLIDLPGNPAFITLGPGMQLARLSSELFGEGPAVERGWIRIASEQPIDASYQFGGSEQLDGGVAAARQQSLLYFTRACQGPGSCSGFTGRTLIGLANPNSSPVTIRAVLHPGAAAPLRDTVRTIPGNGTLTGDLAELFGAEAVSDGFVEVEVVDGPGITGSQIIELTETASLVSLPGLAQDASASLYSAHLADLPGVFTTSLQLINTGQTTRTVRVSVIADDGKMLAEGNQLRLDGLTSARLDAGSLLGSATERIGSLKVEADGPGITGSVLFGSADGKTAAASPLQGEPVREVVFGQVANGMGMYTGLAVFNPGNEAVSVTVRVFTAEGGQSGETTIALQPGNRLSRQLPELVPATAGQIGGYIRISATGPIITQELFGGDRFLSAVAPSVR